jgi:hypothetical protein
MQDLSFNQLCTPAQIYFALTILATVLAIFQRVPIFAVLFKLFFAFGWTYILNMLCRSGNKPIAWFLVVFPYILIMVGYACMGAKRRR